MNIVCDLCGTGRTCLCSSWDFLHFFSPRERMDEGKLEKTLCDLQSDGYLDVVFSERKGERMYVLSLRGDVQAFRRESLQWKRNVCFRVAFAVGGAVLSFLVGMLLRLVFL